MSETNDKPSDAVAEAAGKEKRLHRRPVYVIGHLNPDTDAICAAIGYADLLQRTYMPEAVAACCGAITPRTDWVLRHAGMEAPVLLMDVRPTVETICRPEVVTAEAEETFLEVYHRMDRAGIRALPIVDGEGRVVAVPSMEDLLALLMHSTEALAADPDEARMVCTSLANIARTLPAEIDHGVDLEQEREFILTVSASGEETVAQRIGRYPARSILVVVGDRPRVQRLVLEHGVGAMLLTGGARLSEELLELARAKGTSVLRFAEDTASATHLVRCSRRVASVEARQFLSFSAKTLVASVYQQVQDSPQVLFPVVAEGGDRLIGVFSKSDLLESPRQRLILVDHNEFAQAIRGADEAEIIEVIDHHRLGGNLVSREPIRFVNEPVGSTSTIVARMFREHKIKPDRGVAICLCAGIISDTLNLTSPTATDMDREMLPWLARTAKIEIDAFTREFFSAGSMLSSWPADKMIALDRKEFQDNGWKISISQIEEVGLESFSERREDLQQALEDLIEERKLDFAALLVTDITYHYSLLLVAGHEAIIGGISYPTVAEKAFRLEGVVSRKKQFFPYLSRILVKAVKTGQ